MTNDKAGKNLRFWWALATEAAPRGGTQVHGFIVFISSGKDGGGALADPDPVGVAPLVLLKVGLQPPERGPDDHADREDAGVGEDQRDGVDGPSVVEAAVVVDGVGGDRGRGRDDGPDDGRGQERDADGRAPWAILLLELVGVDGRPPLSLGEGVGVEHGAEP